MNSAADSIYTGRVSPIVNDLSEPRMVIEHSSEECDRAAAPNQRSATSLS
jgi:hypothetical protein